MSDKRRGSRARSGAGGARLLVVELLVVEQLVSSSSKSCLTIAKEFCEQAKRTKKEIIQYLFNIV
jgi:hypothetical protein